MKNHTVQPVEIDETIDFPGGVFTGEVIGFQQPKDQGTIVIDHGGEGITTIAVLNGVPDIFSATFYESVMMIPPGGNLTQDFTNGQAARGVLENAKEVLDGELTPVEDAGGTEGGEDGDVAETAQAEPEADQAATEEVSEDAGNPKTDVDTSVPPDTGKPAAPDTGVDTPLSPDLQILPEVNEKTDTTAEVLDKGKGSSDDAGCLTAPPTAGINAGGALLYLATAVTVILRSFRGRKGTKLGAFKETDLTNKEKTDLNEATQAAQQYHGVAHAAEQARRDEATLRTGNNGVEAANRNIQPETFTASNPPGVMAIMRNAFTAWWTNEGKKGKDASV